MSTTVEESIEVNLPVSTVYNQWTQFEDFPQFMSGVTSVTQLSDDRLEWIAEIAGVRRRWEAKIEEQVPERKIAWAATEGATNAGAVTFQDLGGRTVVHLSLQYEPEGLVEKVGDKLNVVENRAKGDLERFKNFIESEGYATGAWRGSVNPSGVGGTPSVDDADASRGDQGKAGVSGKAVAAGLGAAAVAAAGTAAGIAAAGKSNKSPTTPVERVEPDQVAPAPPARVSGEPAPGRVISYEEASEIVENAQNLPRNENDDR
ncbi:MAG TPA: SRPBCC family protein [Microlunatus sp.]|nr:SRPBCC family protein [Microlunatus sp.]